ncbi:MAG: hypothetical protein RLZZ396_2810 [Planctomycetota bacterium]
MLGIPRDQLDRKERTGLALLTAMLLCGLGIAAWLSPDPSGHGTHRQLGLPPCSSVLALGIKCPACGMTTSWALMIEGRIAEALVANVGGSLLFLVAFVSIPWLLWILWSGKRRLKDQWGMFALGGSAGSMLIAFATWAWSLLIQSRT